MERPGYLLSVEGLYVKINLSENIEIVINYVNLRSFVKFVPVLGF